MITALDSNVLIDLLGQETQFTAPTIASLDQAREHGALVICPVVAAEISGYFLSHGAMHLSLREMGITVDSFSLDALHLAGNVFLKYRVRSSRPKDRVLADFLVGAHALRQADALLTRDRGYYRTYFPKLRVVEP